MSTPPDLPIVAFESPQEWEEWLAQNHAGSSGIWLRFFRKGTNIRSINYAEALDEALCYGWIDGQGKRYDEQSEVYSPSRSKRMVEAQYRADRAADQGREDEAGRSRSD